MLRLSLCAAFLVAVFACSSPSYHQFIASADNIALQAGFKKDYISGGPFKLLTYTRVKQGGKVATVYIEGDGRAWITRNRVSLNPTPQYPLALELAASDTSSESIIYLGRPCQYRPTMEDDECDPSHWTMARYSSMIIESMNDALDRLKRQHNFEHVVLVGYSGGGAIAVLMAAEREDVTAIVTVAANLDVAAFTEWHKVSPMSDSLNPVDFTESVKAIPQQHFFGMQDLVVPMHTVDKYKSLLSNQPCVSFIEFDNTNHRQGWKQLWPKIFSQNIPC